MIVLAIDTALDACQAAVLDGDRVLAVLSEAMQRGHQERLAPMVREVLALADVGVEALGRIGVTTGPGSFTGLRVGLAFAKGLALARAVPCVGIGTLQALAASVDHEGPIAAVVDARRGQVYLQLFEAGAPLGPPEALAPVEAAGRVASYGEDIALVGSGAWLVEPLAPKARLIAREVPDPAAVARIAARAPAPDRPPGLVYLRAPDARLPA